MLTDIFDRPVTPEMWRTITGIEELGRRGIEAKDHEALAWHLSAVLEVPHSEALQRVAWFDEWMREPEFIDVPGSDDRG